MNYKINENFNQMADQQHRKPVIVNCSAMVIADYCKTCNKVVVVDVDSEFYFVCFRCESSEYVCHLCREEGIKSKVFVCEECSDYVCTNHGNRDLLLCDECIV